ncbi:MAG: hypothetical protein ACK5LP_07760 [Campylobacteraceae bacterium]
MVRTLSIEIIGISFFIESDLKGNDKNYDFPIIANYRVVDGKIAYIHDIFCDSSLIKECQEFGGFFLEKCLFTCKDKTFEGDFIDAFIFIHNTIKEERKNDKRKDK